MYDTAKPIHKFQNNMVDSHHVGAHEECVWNRRPPEHSKVSDEQCRTSGVNNKVCLCVSVTSLIIIYFPAEASPCPCDGEERLRWEKIFIMMEDSHVMQKILLQANEELKMEISSLRNHIQKISRDISTSCRRVMEETCRSMNVQQNLRADQNTTRLTRDVQQNVTVQQLEETEEVRKREDMKDLKNVEMTEMDKSEKMEESDKWWRWTKWRFWRWWRTQNERWLEW